MDKQVFSEAKLDDRLRHPISDDRNHPKLDECLRHPISDDRNHPKLDDYCLFLFYIEANELKSSKIG